MCILLLCPTFISGIIILSIWVGIKKGIDIKLNTDLWKFAFFLSLFPGYSWPSLPSLTYTPHLCSHFSCTVVHGTKSELDVAEELLVVSSNKDTADWCVELNVWVSAIPWAIDTSVFAGNQKNLGQFFQSE